MNCKIIKGNTYLNTHDNCLIRIDNIDHKAVYFSLLNGYTTINAMRFTLGSIFHNELVPYVDFSKEIEDL